MQCSCKWAKKAARGYLLPHRDFEREREGRGGEGGTDPRRAHGATGSSRLFVSMLLPYIVRQWTVPESRSSIPASLPGEAASQPPIKRAVQLCRNPKLPKKRLTVTYTGGNWPLLSRLRAVALYILYTGREITVAVIAECCSL